MTKGVQQAQTVTPLPDEIPKTLLALSAVEIGVRAEKLYLSLSCRLR